MKIFPSVLLAVPAVSMLVLALFLIVRTFFARGVGRSIFVKVATKYVWGHLLWVLISSLFMVGLFFSYDTQWAIGIGVTVVWFFAYWFGGWNFFRRKMKRVLPYHPVFGQKHKFPVSMLEGIGKFSVSYSEKDMKEFLKRKDNPTITVAEAFVKAGVPAEVANGLLRQSKELAHIFISEDKVNYVVIGICSAYADHSYWFDLEDETFSIFEYDPVCFSLENAFAFFNRIIEHCLSPEFVNPFLTQEWFSIIRNGGPEKRHTWEKLQSVVGDSTTILQVDDVNKYGLRWSLETICWFKQHRKKLKYAKVKWAKEYDGKIPEDTVMFYIESNVPPSFANKFISKKVSPKDIFFLHEFKERYERFQEFTLAQASDEDALFYVKKDCNPKRIHILLSAKVQYELKLDRETIRLLSLLPDVKKKDLRSKAIDVATGCGLQAVKAK